jgi:hypothetical protein
MQRIRLGDQHQHWTGDDAYHKSTQPTSKPARKVLKAAADYEEKTA